ncbi:MAG: nucleotidyltransferase domain-containing protein [Bacteroidetes bacterium]|nr:nucleotidyltransferase domain-containing protein [Bacteroidota bacterium]
MYKPIRQKLPILKEMLVRHGVIEAYLFGSAAKGGMNRTSDVDFLVQFDPTLDYVRYSDNYFSLLTALRNLLKRDIDLVATETVTNPYLAQSIDQSKIKIL